MNGDAKLRLLEVATKKKFDTNKIIMVNKSYLEFMPN